MVVSFGRQASKIGNNSSVVREDESSGVVDRGGITIIGCNVVVFNWGVVNDTVTMLGGIVSVMQITFSG